MWQTMLGIMWLIKGRRHGCYIYEEDCRAMYEKEKFKDISLRGISTFTTRLPCVIWTQCVHWGPTGGKVLVPLPNKGKFEANYGHGAGAWKSSVRHSR